MQSGMPMPSYALPAKYSAANLAQMRPVNFWWSSGVEMTVVRAEGTVTYGIGLLMGRRGL